MASYSLDDAERDLRAALDKAPAGAVRGDWTVTTMQAGHSSMSGGYHRRDGSVVASDKPQFDILEEVVARLGTNAATPFNVVSVHWIRATLPWQRGRVTVETAFDAALVPRGPDNPVYAAASDARRRFWKSVGAVEPGFAAERGTANTHGQTKWYQPHRRILKIEDGDAVLLATDGLSTPWAGVTTQENGVECEIFMRLDGAGNPVVADEASVALWSDVLIAVGDLVADGYRVLRDVQTNGAILFCRLPEDCRPMTRMALHMDLRSIEGLPFGPVSLIEATPLREDEPPGLEDAPWGTAAALRALKTRVVPNR
ncbi:hypothetical protein SAMN04487843_13913 [Methylobacterium sp. ap11]|uniref:hypothetical protein n=1 Tax=Methylobacterium sp. ap11 TaxID=1761799 RepID=UPI0008CDC765|nr:hypothetical protein [Methylobacterium sp. ap11]SEP50680.1 hypothetical protein SAMN04487843_13913 [Methylobacterium sp. ap11]